ncbi:AAA ATPase domain-containing protein [Nitrosospira sp. Nsp14]|uniref:ATP-binding protein n=1 Tax=Nitrosospira sp. Nsp14 TaxID=1855333 RepID=UPI0008E670A8|nr:ATP-binding protein [Nitrosospira sp. Nsp14]SFH44364.1 AAA ATPase domain-containing protein [Nitrosospira sp. Nsp14]
MKLETVSLKNFRCYKDVMTIQVGKMTTFVGKNDVGKSSVLEALEIFFNNDIVAIEPSDANVNGGSSRVEITCEFSDLPSTLTLDAGAETTLADEYLLSSTGKLKIQKVFDCSVKKPVAEVFVLAEHPTADGVSNLLELKEKDLQKLVRERSLDVGLKGNPSMRRAIWAAADELALAEVPISVSKGKEDSKRIWDQLGSYLPIFALFQSDRTSKDSDGEVQNPIKAAVAAAIAEVGAEIAQIQSKVQQKAEEIAKNTLEALKTIDSQLAGELTPEFAPPSPAKWTALFSAGLATEAGIPLNKRGSGVRRLVLVAFFKAEAERRLKNTNKRSIIYAIEEPETGQHPNNQRVLVQSLNGLANEPGCQVMLTTHSPGLASELPLDSIRYLYRDRTGSPKVDLGIEVFGPVADALGVIPDSRTKVLFCVEGPTDITAYKCLSHALHLTDPTIVDLSQDDRVAFVPLGGSTLRHWVADHYLRPLRRTEFHIYDRDVPDYQNAVDEIMARGDGAWAALTTKYEIESYLHPDAIADAFDIAIEISDHPGEDKKTVPELFGEAYALKRGHGAPLSDSKAKKKLSEAFSHMSAERIRERDPNGEVENWFRKVGEIIDKT